MRMYSVSFGFSYLKDRKGNFVVLSDYILLSEKRKKKIEKRKITPICSSLGTQI